MTKTINGQNAKRLTQPPFCRRRKIRSITPVVAWEGLLVCPRGSGAAASLLPVPLGLRVTVFFTPDGQRQVLDYFFERFGTNPIILYQISDADSMGFRN
jgi:hypothetical protein